MTVEAATPVPQKLHTNTYRTEDLKATSTIGIIKSEMTTVVLQASDFITVSVSATMNLIFKFSVTYWTCKALLESMEVITE